MCLTTSDSFCFSNTFFSKFASCKFSTGRFHSESTNFGGSFSQAEPWLVSLTKSQESVDGKRTSPAPSLPSLHKF